MVYVYSCRHFVFYLTFCCVSLWALFALVLLISFKIALLLVKTYHLSQMFRNECEDLLYWRHFSNIQDLSKALLSIRFNWWKRDAQKPLLSFSNHWRCFAILFSPFFQALKMCVHSMWAYICKYLRTRMHTTVLHFICVCVYTNANNVRSWMLTAFLPPNKMFFLYVNGLICVYARSSSWCDHNITVYSVCFLFRTLPPYFYSWY